MYDNIVAILQSTNEDKLRLQSILWGHEGAPPLSCLLLNPAIQVSYNMMKWMNIIWLIVFRDVAYHRWTKAQLMTRPQTDVYRLLISKHPQSARTARKCMNWAWRKADDFVIKQWQFSLGYVNVHINWQWWSNILTRTKTMRYETFIK